VLKEVRELTALCKPESDPDTFIMQYYCNHSNVSVYSGCLRECHSECYCTV
jgi:hypothetical protein